MTKPMLDPALYQKLRYIVYQQFKLSSSNAEHPRPEGVVLLVNNVPFPGHAHGEISAVEDALSILKLSLKAGKRKIQDNPVTFAIAAVGMAADETSVRKPSDDFLRDLKAYKGAAGLKEIEVFAGHNTDETYILKIGRKTGSDPAAKP